MSVAVECEALRRGFGATDVIDGLDLAVAEGERVAVLGANGSGKTTLLRVLAGLLRPEAGRCAVLGGSPSASSVRARVGLLAHRPPLYPKLTAAENVRFWARIHGVVHPAPGDLLAAVGLDPTDRRPSGTYSHGMRRRAGLACALVHDPALLLLDEPFAGLDPEGAAAVAALLSTVGRAVVFTTHEPVRADEVGARALRLVDGRLRDTVSA